MRTIMPGLDWSDARLIPAFQMVIHLDVYDLRGASRPELITATVIAGLVNRPRPRIYLIACEDDVFWLQQALRHVSTTYFSHHGSESLHALLFTYRSLVQGVIIYQSELLDTINIATTMAGQRDALIADPELAVALIKRYHLPVVDDLRKYGWRSRLQAYHWAVQQLLPRSSPRILAGLDPGAFCGLRSFLVATGAFVYWLDSQQYLPDFTAGMLSERALMQQLFATYAPTVGAVHLGWVIHEQSAVALASEAGMAVVASDYVLNLEVWTAVQPEALPLPATHMDVPPLEDKIYLSFTMSDGDNLQYCQHHLRTIWNDPARETVPLGWTMSPLLAQAMPALAAYYTSTAGPNDELIAGPSGMGYIYPSRYPRARQDLYLQQTGSLMHRLGMTSLTLLDVDALYRTGLPLVAAFSFAGMRLSTRHVQQEWASTLARYGVTGILNGAGFTGRPAQWHNQHQLVFHNTLGFTTNVERTVRLIKLASRIFRRRPLFLHVYLIAWNMTPTAVQQILQQLGPDYECILPRTMFALQAHSHKR
ncbi:GxGYxYP domain-containing protein [Dictyobacter arantiisoli]|uniref:GxGYxYP putative glycoside hydrolase N-terminal domain-containing protein n=1 Tax=Dictyobacter arantiisoli TaxID=2014874 RepID=A0A5A5TC50_9CHLR|nr:GxGYxYP domain-containing protein [Dictyobacter arantiisoli]GCF08603.1 hypothetical protein KDI_21670 [Dictyobacter arantiisoli]